MQLVPLQHLDIHLLEVEAARQHPGNLTVPLDGTLRTQQFHDASILAVLDSAIRLRDEVGVVFSAHGPKLKEKGRLLSVNGHSIARARPRTGSRPWKELDS